MSRLYRPGDVSRVLDGGGSASLEGWRSEFRRDLARLIHSPAFRRLQGKTQLFAGAESDFFRNRLTHSLEVAQIAKSIALKLNYEVLDAIDSSLDLDLVELGGLAHDLGHPPFGHTGEAALNRQMLEFGGFEGNAQTLRILARLEKKLERDATVPSPGAGLNLTLRSLASILKYDKEMPERRSAGDESSVVKGYYASERELVAEIRTAVARDVGAPLKTIECQVMDLADDIAYSTYDIEDAFKSGLLNPLDLAGAEDSTLARVRDRCVRELGLADVTLERVQQVLERMFRLYVGEPRLEEPEPSYGMKLASSYRLARLTAESGFLRCAFTSGRVDRAIQAISVEPDADDPPRSKVTMDPEIRLEVAVLKHLVYELLIESPRLKLVARRGTRIVESIFDELCDDGGHELMPPDWIERYEQAPGESERRRVVADFIAGMTDRQAVDFHARLTSSDYRTMFSLA